MTEQLKRSDSPTPSKIRTSIKQLEIKLGTYIGQSPAPVYQIGRMVKTSFDRLEIFTNSFTGKTPILVYQMGRVGSTSIYESLKLADLSSPVYHVHYLNQSSIDAVEGKYKTRKQPVPRFIVVGKMLLQEMNKKPKGSKWKIVTLVREPISASLSQIFYDPEVHHPKLFDQSGNIIKEEALNYSQERLAKFDEATWYTGYWFAKEFQEALNVDIYDHPFNLQDGYSIIETEDFSILVLRLEDLSANFSQAMTDFLGVRNIQLLKSNANENRTASEAYKYVCDHIAVPQEVCDRIYSSRYARHFYGERCHQLAEKWTHPKHSLSNS